MKSWKFLTLTICLAGSLSGCTSTTINANKPPLIDMDAKWVMLPSINNTETPQAGGRLDSIASSLMRTRGFDISMYNAEGTGDENTFDAADRRQQERALERAGKAGFRYAIAGSVNEWRYKVGMEGEPAAGISISIIDTSTGAVIWSGSAARTGSGQSAVSATAQDLVSNLLDRAFSNSSVAAH